MARDASAYATLGLEPGADSVAIERAYKRLIKEHHPDRAGGDAKRAAEINKAYRELRDARPNAIEMHDEALEAEQSRIWVKLAFGLVAGIAIVVLASRPFGAPLERWWLAAGKASTVAERGASTTDAMDQPLTLAAIDGAVTDARRIAAQSDEMALAAESQACHQRLRGKPSLAQLDRCAAFDDAVTLLQDRDPLRDRGPFSQLAVTARQWNAASALSNDYLAIDGRLDRIRLRVELALAPPNDSGEN